MNTSRNTGFAITISLLRCLSSPAAIAEDEGPGLNLFAVTDDAEAEAAGYSPGSAVYTDGENGYYEFYSERDSIMEKAQG